MPAEPHEPATPGGRSRDIPGGPSKGSGRGSRDRDSRERSSSDDMPRAGGSSPQRRAPLRGSSPAGGQDSTPGMSRGPQLEGPDRRGATAYGVSGRGDDASSGRPSRSGEGGPSREGSSGRDRRPGRDQAPSQQTRRQGRDRDDRGRNDRGRADGGRNDRGGGRPGWRRRPDGASGARTPVAGSPRPDRPRVPAPPLPEGITGQEIARAVQAEFSSFPPDTALRLARHLVAAGQLLVDDPDAAYAHAVYVKSRAPRLASVREAAGLAAYAAGHYDEAMSDLRAARRMTGAADLLPVIADVERALGRPERALEIASSSEVSSLDADGRIEMRIVAAGARRDLGQLEAAVLTLQVPEVRRSARLAYAYADALLAAGRREQAREAFQLAASLDRTGETDADERLAELDGLVFLDLEDDEDAQSAVDQQGTRPAEAAESPASMARPEDARPAADASAPLFLPPTAG